MPSNPITTLLSHRQPLRDDVRDALAQLDQLAETRADLADLATTYAALLRVAFREPPPTPTVELDRARAATKLQGGVPLLRGEPIALDGRWLRGQYLRLCDAVLDSRDQRSDSGRAIRGAARALRQATKTGTLDIAGHAGALIATGPHDFAERVARLNLDAELAGSLLRWTLLPLLEQVALQLRPVYEVELWQAGYCPICGSWPLLGERRGIEQMPFLRCGLCASDWRLWDLACPFCDTHNYRDLAYLYDESDAGTQRAMTCDRCRGYYKSVATLAPLTTPMLMVTDLATLHLDLIALERAYAPPS